jgi:hypothetical protein
MKESKREMGNGKWATGKILEKEDGTHSSRKS